ncbi:MAG: acyl-CoA thioesterase [Ignavibacteria bacterium CG_4_8_14_3_um_filter_37_9]|nr:acyl-CoA thioesterase [Ignavibacteria bacterium]OIO22945.1 MAG: acyl-CoA thioesterase [Ignavibacteria bacterium CG1_02_37_35]PIP76930.1 MAG: acyl-CoA thioesterase [Ignavibacteria bacterium CG22_combo_CG10-13_8_21_14_all_37_15]PIS46349.1 MAG: acyl-CoA thioesterase [Ignavibacteria bacterium CG08_land_8_20_14_0_20_37_9]PIW99159.1 MAG: acyl-CoA thioesterase [Ignavibacteria bacterium CG_4_8_14_3_um_filter_37_9]PIX93439.1 MAG: acyl-CoA thioesterase [Ignavibacteria bacterium CG_4_10_14_3_um_filter
MSPKKVGDSIMIMTELVLPQHTNQLGNLLGGQLMHWIDICAALCAAKHSQRVCVTASVDSIGFHHPIKLGQAVSLVASVNRVFKTSLEVGVKVFAESFREGKRVHTNSAYLTFVSVDEEAKPVEAIKVVPETEDEKRRFEKALQRRETRLAEKKSH